MENLAANGAVSSVQVTEGFKPVPSRGGSSSRPAQLRLRYTFTAYDVRHITMTAGPGMTGRQAGA